jgi:DNA polymerase elongation subunit (family B)
MIIPDFKHYTEDEKKILYANRIGAYVRDPLVGIWRWVGSFDANSLYPSIIRTLNIGFETIVTFDMLPLDFQIFIKSIDWNVAEYEGNHHIKIKEYAQRYKKYTGVELKLSDLSILNIPKDAIYEEVKSKTKKKEVKRFSLYKEIIRATVDLMVERDIMKLMTPYLEKYNLAFAPNFAFFKRDKISLLNSAMTRYYTKRKGYQAQEESYKNLYKGKKEEIKQCGEDKKIKQKLKQELYEYEIKESNYNQFSTLYKLLINSGYGAISHPSCRFFNVDITNAITSTSQYIMKRCAIDIDNLIEIESGVKQKHIIYGDTDSIYVDFSYAYKGDVVSMVEYLKGFQLKVESSLTQTVTQMNAFDPNILKMKIEKLADSTFFQAPKKYVTRNMYKDGVFYLDKQKITPTGLSIQNINTPDGITDWLDTLVTFYLNEDRKGLIDYISKIKKEFRQMDLKLICNIKNVNLYDNYVMSNGKKDKTFRGSNYELNKQCPPTVRASAYHNFLIEQGKIDPLYKIQDGDKVLILYIKPSKTAENLIAFREDEPISISRELIDWDVMFDKVVLSNIKPFQEILNWKLEYSRLEMFQMEYGEI